MNITYTPLAGFLFGVGLVASIVLMRVVFHMSICG